MDVHSASSLAKFLCRIKEVDELASRVAAGFFEREWSKTAASQGSSFAGDKESVYIASQVVQTGKCHRVFPDRHTAKLVEAQLARYNIGVVSMETGAWGWVYEGSTYFQNPV